jgi:hypothetical protein
MLFTTVLKTVANSDFGHGFVSVEEINRCPSLFKRQRLRKRCLNPISQRFYFILLDNLAKPLPIAPFFYLNKKDLYLLLRFETDKHALCFFIDQKMQFPISLLLFHRTSSSIN